MSNNKALKTDGMRRRGGEQNEEDKEVMPSSYSIHDTNLRSRMISIFDMRNAKEGVYPERELQELKEDQPYKTPFGNSSTIVAASHFFRSVFSPTILAMPAAFRSGGLVFSVFGHVFLTALISYNIGRLVVCADYLSKREKVSVQTYDQVAFVAFRRIPKTNRYAKQLRALVNLMFIITSMDALTIFVIFIARNFEAMISEYFPDIGLQIRHYIFFEMVPIMLMNTVRQLKYLSPFSIISSILLFIACCGAFNYFFLPEMQPIKEREFFRPQSIFRFIAIILFSQSGLSIALTIKSSMRNPHHFLGKPGIFYVTIILTTLIYVPFGFFGFLRYGNDVYPSIMLNLPVEETNAVAIKLIAIISIYLAMPITFFVAFNSLWNNFVKHRVREVNHIYFEYLLRAILLTLLYGIATAFPTLGPMIVLKGALLHSQLEVVYPPILEYVSFYPEKGNGKAYWRLFKAIIIAMCGLLFCVAGTVAGILDLIHGSKELVD